ncbi:MAG TPA: AAA family ATPase [Chthonomonadaceae bacterium]|nr:AAA family ATPase [Chthonomonadaceae bacterium]
MAELFTLSPRQEERLLASQAAWEEGEDEERLERLRQREEDGETLRAFSRLLRQAGLAEGGALTRAQMASLLALARALAPNPNLDARLLQRPGEPEALNRDLQELLFGRGDVALRLRGFLARRHAGGQTASQLLCAAFPGEWPLVTQAGLRALELTPEQVQMALKAARQRFDLPAEPVGKEAREGVGENDPVLRLLADFVAYAAVREAITASDYVEVHRLLTQGLAGRAARSRRRAQAPLLYADRRDTVRLGAGEVREGEETGYEAAPEETALPEAPDLAGASEAALLASLEQAIAAQGFTYPPLAVRDYYISLQTKPFCILAGITGTGKTRLTALFAEALTGDAASQYRLLPVRPDWADSTPLLGYVNLLAGGGEGRFVSTPFLEFLRRASRPENAYRAFFLCLDEMNLAKVEHYLAEILSAMETPNRELLLPNGQAVRLPANLFVTGTLNVDEATHSLSRKVLDRANMISLQEVRLREDPAGKRSRKADPLSMPPSIRQALFLQRRVTSVAAARAQLERLGKGRRSLVANVVQALAEINDLLEPHGLHFGYRVRDEALRYCANSFDQEGQGLLTPEAPGDRKANLQMALDLQVLQKVLPRFTGSQEQIEQPLEEMLRWARKAGLPQTARRLERLLARVQRDGFASFDEP